MKRIIFILLFLNLFFSCKKQQNKIHFQKTSDGLQYAFIVENKDKPQPQIGEGVIIDVKIYCKDSLLFNSKELGHAFRLKINKPKYKASIDTALMMMHLGDSAIFKIDAIDFYTYSADKTPKPDFIKKGDSLTFFIKLRKIISKEQIQQEEQRLRKIQMFNEIQTLYQYLEENNIDVEPTESGLYFIPLKKGYGRKPKLGDSVIFNYTVWLINGEKIESTFDTGKPFRAKLGDSTLYKGVEEGLLYMKEGEIAKLIVPSKLALGDKGIPDLIPPFSTLIFKIELVKVKPNQ